MREAAGVRPLDPQRFHVDVDHLAARHPELRDVVERWGVPDLWRRSPGFAALALAVLEQQVSLASARAVHDRLAAALDGITAATVAGADEATVRAAGVTRQKASYLRGLAEAVRSGALDLDGLADLGDDEVRGALVAQRGVGSWTADVYLLVCLLRRDVWPVGDRALQVATRDALGLDETPDARALAGVGDRWRPRRSVAARLLWHGYLAERGRPPPTA